MTVTISAMPCWPRVELRLRHPSVKEREEEEIPLSEGVRQTFIELLSKGHCIRSPARANSMAPFIRKGDLLTVEPITFAQARIGNILACRRDEGESVLTTHRVIQRGEDAEGPYLVTKGDRNYFRDLPIRQPTHVYGRVISVEKNGRLISLETPVHRLLAYFMARLSLGRCYFRSALSAPHLVPVRLIRRILRISPEL